MMNSHEIDEIISSYNDKIYDEIGIYFENNDDESVDRESISTSVIFYNPEKELIYFVFTASSIYNLNWFTGKIDIKNNTIEIDYDDYSEEQLVQGLYHSAQKIGGFIIPSDK